MASTRILLLVKRVLSRENIIVKNYEVGPSADKSGIVETTWSDY